MRDARKTATYGYTQMRNSTQMRTRNALKIKTETSRGKLPGLVVNVKDSHSEQWSSDVSSIPWFT